MSDQQDSGSSSVGSAPAAGNSSGCCAQPVNVQQVKSQLSNRFQTHKSLVLKLHSVLSWEQDLHAGIVFGAVSAFFLLIHLLNSSVLSTLSYLGIAIALFDLAAPMIATKLSSTSAKLSDKDNQRFDKICLDLAKVYAFFHGLCSSSCSLKTQKPKMYYPGLLGSLLVLAYIGNKVNNLFLTYLLVLSVAFYPGLEKRGITQKIVDQVLVTLGRRPASSASSSGSERRGSGKKN